MNKPRLEVYNIDGVTPDMIAADALHHSQFAHDTRDILHGSLSDKQKDYLRDKSNDYQLSKNNDKMSEEYSMRNGVDAAMRGYVVGQWPKEVNDGMQYTPHQIELLDDLKRYMKTGKH